MILVDVRDTDPCIRGLCSYTIIGSRVCKPCNVLNVQNVSMDVISMM